MSFPNKKYEFLLQENKIYRLEPVDFVNAPKSIHISGTGTVDIRGCTETPTSLNDDRLTLDEGDTNIFGFFQMSEINYIKITPNQEGIRRIVLSGFNQPEIIFE